MEFFKKIGLQVKIIFGAIAGFLGVLLFFFVRQKVRAKEHVQYELDRVKSEISITHLAEDSKEKEEKLEELKKEEVSIREKIEYIEKIEVEEKREVSIEELDAFFDKRGF